MTEQRSFRREIAGLRIDEMPTSVTRVDSKHRNASAWYKSEHAVDATLSLFSVLTVFCLFFVCGALNLRGLVWRVVLSPTRLLYTTQWMPQHSGLVQVGNSHGAVDKKSEYNAKHS